MNWLTFLLVFIGLACFPLSITAFMDYRRSQELVKQLSGSKLLKAAQLRSLRQSNQNLKGRESKGTDLVQVYGRIVTQNPLTAEFSQQPCVYYKSKVTWEYEEIKYLRKDLDGQGNVIRETYISEFPDSYYHQPNRGGYGSTSLIWEKKVGPINPSPSPPRKLGATNPSLEKKMGSVNAQLKQKLGSSLVNKMGSRPTYVENGCEYFIQEESNSRSEVIHSVTRQISFFLEDETGRVKIDPNGAEIEATVAVDDHVSAPSSHRGVLQYGGFSTDITGRLEGRNRRTKFFVYEEHIIPVDTAVFVMGKLSFEAGEAVIRKPVDESRFVISPKSNEELLKEHQNNIQNNLFTSIASLIVGVVTVIYLLSRLSG
ncbi:MAG: E3 ubiquitin ligase family protein [Thermostichus sp. DRC_bins_24]